ncbi:hypothetical protein [Coraliomargarita sinensis]|nr:hypothetical protein [Coraliomargarita sinensis]
MSCALLGSGKLLDTILASASASVSGKLRRDKSGAATDLIHP